jgi:hypothetical protein
VSHYTGAVPDTRRGPDWRTRAACRADGISPDAMFPDSDKERTKDARVICAGCPVRRPCLREAIDSGDNQWGIRGGLMPEERRAVQEELDRRKAAEEVQESAPAETPKPPARKSYTDLRSLFDDHTKRIIHGHLAWTGPAKPSFEGRAHNPKQIAFLLDRGRAPVGRVLTTCSVSGCVLPAHVADDEERARCGTRLGYRRHLANGQTPCDPCRQANTDADNRLRRTGTSKVAA